MHLFTLFKHINSFYCCFIKACKYKLELIPFPDKPDTNVMTILYDTKRYLLIEAAED